jgi:hypothetical protein
MGRQAVTDKADIAAFLDNREGSCQRRWSAWKGNWKSLRNSLPSEIQNTCKSISFKVLSQFSYKATVFGD